MDDKDFLIQDLERELHIKNETVANIIEYNGVLKSQISYLGEQIAQSEDNLGKRTRRMLTLESRQRVLRRFLKDRCEMGIADVDEFITELKFDAVMKNRGK